MQALWSERRRIGLWRRLWLALMESERELGLDIPAEAIAQLRAHLDDVDLARAAEFEKRMRHDVMAHIHALGEQAPAARPFLHLGATSAFVTDNADLVLMREGLALLLGRVAAVLVALSHMARRHRALPCLAYTHFQPAQLTTVGKRATLWMQEFLLDAEELLHRTETLQFRGVKGTTGTQASFLELFDGDHEKVRELDARVSAKLGLPEGASRSPARPTPASRTPRCWPRSPASPPRRRNSRPTCACCSTRAELLEPFESEQVGSSRHAVQAQPDAGGADDGPGPLRHRARRERLAHRRRAMARAHARRQREPPPDHSRSVPRHRRDPGARDERGRGSRGARSGDPPARGGRHALPGDRAPAHARA